ncbi:MAG: DUF1700 domain-containing protein [Pseudomonadota bacterium]
MSESAKIEKYLKNLAQHLAGLSSGERDEIVKEIRAHLEHRLGENRLDETFEALGSPDQCAHSFYEQRQIETALHDGGVAKVIGTLLTLATSRTLAVVGLLTSSLLFIFAAAFGLMAVAKIVAPDHVGLWVVPDEGFARLGFSSVAPEQNMVEVLGFTLTPLAVALAVFALVTGHSIGRYCLARMNSRRL